MGRRNVRASDVPHRRDEPSSSTPDRAYDREPNASRRTRDPGAGSPRVQSEGGAGSAGTRNPGGLAIPGSRGSSEPDAPGTQRPGTIGVPGAQSPAELGIRGTRKPRTRGGFRSALLRILLLASTLSLVGRAAAAPDPRYLDYDTIVQTLQSWAQLHPGIIHLETIGRTGLGEPIWAAKISDHADIREPEPGLIIHAAQHSNEANGTNAILYTIERLLSRYGQDSSVTSLVDALEIWFVPVVNVDGYRRVISDSPDWAVWRKTMRDNNGDGEHTYPIDGVDTNRNWDWRWAEYGHTDPSDDYYEGPYPFSETEVTSLRDFILDVAPVFLIDLHSPDTMGFHKMVFWPWMDRAARAYSPDQPFFQPIAEAWAAHTETEIDGQHYGSIFGYNDLPKEQNWIYGHTGICSFLMEISDQLWWQGAIVDTIAARVGRGCFYLFDRAAGGPGLTGAVTDALTGAPVVAEVRIEEAYDPGVGPHLTEPRWGIYRRLLLPGNYTLRVSAGGYKTATYPVDVAAEGWTTFDVLLDPLTIAVDEPGSEVDSGRLFWIQNPVVEPVLRFGFSGPGDGSGPLSLELFSPSGRRIGKASYRAPGSGSGTWPLPPGLRSGVYSARVQIGTAYLSRRVVILR